MTQRKLFQVSKADLRQLLCTKEGVPVSQATFWRLCYRINLAEKIGMSSEEFRVTKVFYCEHYERLKTVIGFTDADLLV